MNKKYTNLFVLFLVCAQLGNTSLSYGMDFDVTTNSGGVTSYFKQFLTRSFATKALEFTTLLGYQTVVSQVFVGATHLSLAAVHEKYTNSKKKYNCFVPMGFDKLELPKPILEVLESLKPEKKKKTKDIFRRYKTYRGIILHGPPGTGKSTTALEMARAMNAYYFSEKENDILKGSDFLNEIYVGSGKKRTNKIFDDINSCAKMAEEKGKPLFVPVDEIDTVFNSGKRSNANENKEVQDLLLSKIDTMHQNAILVGTTNHRHLLDGAFSRRFKFIKVSLPNVEERANILKKIAQDCDISSMLNDKFFDTIAENLEGFTGDDIEKVFNKAAELASANNVEFVKKNHFIFALQFYLPEKIEALKIQFDEKTEKLSNVLTEDMKKEMNHELDEIKKAIDKLNNFDPLDYSLKTGKEGENDNEKIVKKRKEKNEVGAIECSNSKKKWKTVSANKKNGTGAITSDIDTEFPLTGYRKILFHPYISTPARWSKNFLLSPPAYMTYGCVATFLYMKYGMKAVTNSYY